MRHTAESPTFPGRCRGQTTLDFAVGMGVFLITVLFVIAYAPTMFDPFAGGTGANLIVADRTATTLSGDLLVGSTAEPGMLSAGCVAGFFDGDGGDQARVDAECAVDIDDVGDLDGTLSLDDRNVNVTIHDLGPAPSGEPSPVDLTWGGETIELTRTNAESDPSDVAVSTRTISIDGDAYRLTVRVW